MEQLSDRVTEIHYLRITEETIEVGLSTVKQLMDLGETESSGEARLLFYVCDSDMDFRRITDLRHIRSASHVIIVREFEREAMFTELRYIILTWLLDCGLL